MQISLESKVAMVTGASSGIGAAIARQLVACGAHVVITGRKQDTIEQVAQDIGPNCLPFAADVSDRADMERMAAAVRQRFGHLDVVGQMRPSVPMRASATSPRTSSTR
jgi:NADP-dependent 3-hydroxy acid dehydrogenase YdfG